MGSSEKFERLQQQFPSILRMEDIYLSIEDAQKDSLRQLKDLKYAGNFGFPSLSDANHVRVRFVRLVILQMVEGEVFAINTRQNRAS
ncbi:hypothetical protein SLS61_008905 [Didymella pomorum]